MAKRELNELELGEINIICIEQCIDKTDYMKECFQGCESTITRLMLKGDFQLVPILEFIVDQGQGTHWQFVVTAVAVIAVILSITLCIVCVRVRRSLHEKQLTKYHKLKAKQAKAHKERGCRRSKEYKKLRKFMTKVMRTTSKPASDEGKTHHSDSQGYLQVPSFTKTAHNDDLELTRKSLQEPLLGGK